MLSYAPGFDGLFTAQTSHTSGAFVDFALSLPSFPEEGEDYSLLELLTGLEALGRNSFQSNRIFIPVLNALNSLFESGGLEELGSDERGADVSVFFPFCVEMGGDVLTLFEPGMGSVYVRSCCWRRAPFRKSRVRRG